MKQKTLVVIANNNLGNALSGGDRIFLELIRNWRHLQKIIVLGSQETQNLLHSYDIKDIDFYLSDTLNPKPIPSLPNLLQHQLRRTIKGVIQIIKLKELILKADHLYTVSDFFPDLIPGIIAKLINPKIKFIAGYYLFAPSPTSADSPYLKTKQPIKGLFYFLSQLITLPIVKLLANHIYVTSEPDVKKFLSKRLNSSSISVIRGGVDITESEKYLKNIDSKTKKIYDGLFVGRFHPQKGVLALIDIWKLVVKKMPQAKLAMIGVGQLENQIRANIKKNKLENNICLLGFMDGSEKFEVFKKSKLILHPATYDSGGMAAAEAMAWGLPGVSFDLEALKTYYPQGMIKTKVGSNKQFADNIIKLLSDKKLYGIVSKQAHELIVKRWDWRKRSKDIYEETFRD